MGKCLGGVAHGVNIHPVSAHSHGAPKARRAEGQLIEETGFDLLLVVYPQKVSHLLEETDRILYQAKEKGRACYVMRACQEA